MDRNLGILAYYIFTTPNMRLPSSNFVGFDHISPQYCPQMSWLFRLSPSLVQEELLWPVWCKHITHVVCVFKSSSMQRHIENLIKPLFPIWLSTPNTYTHKVSNSGEDKPAEWSKALSHLPYRQWSRPPIQHLAAFHFLFCTEKLSFSQESSCYVWYALSSLHIYNRRSLFNHIL